MRKLIVLLTIALLCLTGCGSSSKTARDSAPAVETSAGMSANQSAVSNENADSATANQLEEKNLDRKIVRNAEVKLRVEDIKGVCERLKKKTIALNGYLSDYSFSVNEKNTGANMSLKVPSTNYDQLLEYIDSQGKTDFKQEYTDDVTLEYIDLDARVKVLRTEEESLLNLLNKADKIDDILKIKGQITTTRQERESLEGRLKALNNSIEYATINVTLYQPANSEINVNVENLNIFARCGRALIYGLNLLTAMLGKVVVLFCTVLPAAGLLALILIAFFRIRKLGKKKKEQDREQV